MGGNNTKTIKPIKKIKESIIKKEVPKIEGKNIYNNK